MKRNKTIDELFEMAKNQEPLVSRQKASELVKNVRVTHSIFKSKSIIMKTVFISSLVLTFFVGMHYFGFIPFESQDSFSKANIIESSEYANTDVPNLESELNENNSNIIFAQNDSNSIENNEIVENETNTISAIDNSKKNQLNSSNSKNYPSSFAQNISLNLGEPKKSQKIIERNKCILLTENELAELGISSKNGNLVYEQNKTPLGKMAVNYSKGNGFSYSVSRNILNGAKGTNPIPYFASANDGKYLFSLWIGFERKHDLATCQELSPELLPIWVEMEGAELEAVILWFKNDEHTFKLLPKRIQTELAHNPLRYSVQAAFEKVEAKASKEKLVSEIIIDENQIIDADKGLLQKLGIDNKKGVSYSRESGNCDITIQVNKGIKIHLSGSCPKQTDANEIEKIIPSYMSQQKGSESIKLSSFRKYNQNISTNEIFQNEQTNMLAIRVQEKTSDNPEILFWYQYNEAIANELSQEDKLRIETTLQNLKELPKEGIIEKVPLGNHQSADELEIIKQIKDVKIKGISLNDLELAKLGISIRDQQIIYAFPRISGKEFSLFEVVMSKNGSTITTKMIEDKPDTNNLIKPVFITDIGGNYFKMKAVDTLKMNTMNLSRLVPVKVFSRAYSFTSDTIKNQTYTDLIFWYEPTEKFLSVLDENVANDIQNDIEILICNENSYNLSRSFLDTCDKKSEMSCNYFEACQTHIQKGISAYSLFPNPAVDFINIKLNVSKECNISIYLMTINGKTIQEKHINEAEFGILNDKLMVNSLSARICLVQIVTDLGDKIVERIVVKE